MNGLLAGVLGLPGLPLPKKAGLQQQPDQHPLGRSAASAMAAVAACDGLELVASAAAPASTGVQAAVSNPPRTRSYTRPLTVPTHCLSGTSTRRRARQRGLGGGDDEELGGGGDDGGSWWGGGDGDGPWDPWGAGGDGPDEGGSLAGRFPDLLLLWSVFCALAFAQTLAHVAPKPKATPAFATLSLGGLTAHLLRGGAAPATAAC